jgi:hypothetical protein
MLDIMSASNASGTETYRSDTLELYATRVSFMFENYLNITLDWLTKSTITLWADNPFSVQTEKFSGIDYRSDQLTVRSPRYVYRMALSIVLGLLVILWVNWCLSVIYFFTAPTGVLGLHKLDVQARYYTMANTVTLGTAVRLAVWDSIHCKKEGGLSWSRQRNVVRARMTLWSVRRGKVPNQ